MPHKINPAIDMGRKMKSLLTSVSFFLESRKINGFKTMKIAEPAAISKVFAMSGTIGSDEGFERLISLMEENGLNFYQLPGKSGVIAPDDVVILKINCQWDKRGGTNTDLVKSVAKAVASHPAGFTGEIVVADNGQAQLGSAGTGGSLSWKRSNSLFRDQSVMDVVNGLKKSMRISGVLWDSFTECKVSDYDKGDSKDGFVLEKKVLPSGIQISYPKFKTEYGTYISFRKGLWDRKAKSFSSRRLKVINMPVLKSHILYQATGAVKSYMGTTSCKLTGQRSHKSVGEGGMGAQMALTRMPALNVMDMIWIGAKSGPSVSYSSAVEKNMVAASTDPVALDYWCVKNVLMPEAHKIPPEKAEGFKKLIIAAQSLLMRRDLLDPDKSYPGSFGRWLRLSMVELSRAGVKTAIGDNVVAVLSDMLEYAFLR
jgi:uncharacterized protein (DUF362 family)